MSSPKVWFITGASSGFGLIMTRIVLENGGIAVATLRKPDVLADFSARYSRDKLLIVKVDVSKSTDIVDAFAQALSRFGRVDVVFNNAGYGLMGVEGVPDDIARTTFEVNFWGALNVTKEAVRIFRDVNKPQGGRLIQNSSTLGVATYTSFGYYGAAKHALEAISESLIKELDPAWNIKVTIVEPGSFPTNAVTSSLAEAPIHHAYDNDKSSPAQMRKAIEGRRQAEKQSGDSGYAKSELAMKLVYDLCSLDEPPVRLPLGKDAIELIRAALQGIVANVDDMQHGRILCNNIS